MGTSQPEFAAERGTAGSFPLPQFERVLRGYNPAAVTSFLRMVLGRVRDLENQVTQLQSELVEARKDPSGQLTARTGSDASYEMFSGHVADLVRAFDQDVERIRQEAEAEAKRIIESARAEVEADRRETDERSRETKAQTETMLEEARSEADRIRTDAQARAEEIKAKADGALDEARARATELISDLEARRVSVITDMRSLRGRMLEAASKLDAGLDDQPPVGEVTVGEDGIAVSSEGPGERSEVTDRGW